MASLCGGGGGGYSGHCCYVMQRKGGGGGQHRETEAPLAEQREVLVGQSVVMVGGR